MGDGQAEGQLGANRLCSVTRRGQEARRQARTELRSAPCRSPSGAQRLDPRLPGGVLRVLSSGGPHGPLRLRTEPLGPSLGHLFYGLGSRQRNSAGSLVAPLSRNPDQVSIPAPLRSFLGGEVVPKKLNLSSLSSAFTKVTAPS